MKHFNVKHINRSYFISIFRKPGKNQLCRAFLVYIIWDCRAIRIFCLFYKHICFLLFFSRNYSQVISREVFCHEYGKIPRHTGQNAITEGDLECILTKLLWTEWTVTFSLIPDILSIFPSICFIALFFPCIRTLAGTFST